MKPTDRHKDQMNPKFGPYTICHSNPNMVYGPTHVYIYYYIYIYVYNMYIDILYMHICSYTQIPPIRAIICS